MVCLVWVKQFSEGVNCKAQSCLLYSSKPLITPRSLSALLIPDCQPSSGFPLPSAPPVSPYFAINLFNPALCMCLFLAMLDHFDFLTLYSWSLGLKLSVGHLSITCHKLFKRHMYFRSQTKNCREQVFLFFLSLWYQACCRAGRDTGSSDWDSDCLIDGQGGSACSHWPGRKCPMNKWIHVFQVLWWMATFLLS